MDTQNNSRKCILFAGVAGTSKTPIAYNLSWNLNLPIFNNDTIRMEIKEDTLNNTLDEELFRRTARERLLKLVQSGINFIFDASIDRTFDDNKENLEKAGYQMFIISINLSSEFILNLHESKGYEVNPERVERMQKEHQLFLEKYSNLVNLNIDDNNFKERLEISLEAVKNFL